MEEIRILPAGFAVTDLKRTIPAILGTAWVVVNPGSPRQAQEEWDMRH
jgi:hypothetical protein